MARDAKARSTRKVLDFLHGSVPSQPANPVGGPLIPDAETDEDEELTPEDEALMEMPLTKPAKKTRIY